MRKFARFEVECEGFEDFPSLRRDLIAYIEQFCGHMTLAQAREWFEDAFSAVS
ncbi:MAG TPA: hypothetical protein VFA29_14560 [Candidatus Baltobacteraceae bacterium]|nr:hypothetical protein [Candidatus Baltobacteraceae bacterium]